MNNDDYELYHFGISGMKWGIRRYQNEDGSLTPAGRERYGYNEISKTTGISRGKQIDMLKRSSDRYKRDSGKLNERASRYLTNAKSDRTSPYRAKEMTQKAKELKRSAKEAKEKSYESRKDAGRLGNNYLKRAAAGGALFGAGAAAVIGHYSGAGKAATLKNMAKLGALSGAMTWGMAGLDQYKTRKKYGYE